MQERAKNISAGPSTATARTQVGTGNSTVEQSDLISPITRIVIRDNLPRQAPILDADEDSQRRLIAGTRGDNGRQQPVINADEDSQRRLIAGTRGDNGRQQPVIDADEDSQRQRRPCHSCANAQHEGRASTVVSSSENIMVHTRVPDTFACRVARCPDLVEGTTRAGRPHRTCGAAGGKTPGKLERCPTGHLDRYYQAVNERTLGGRC